MLCYKDMTFCIFYEGCTKASTCGRALTTEVKEAADKWWGSRNGKAPISIFTSIPDCYEHASA